MKKVAPWLGILRIWSLTASTIPVLTGAALAARDNHFSGPLLALTLFSGWLLQIATNLLNTYGDFKSGVDSAARPPTAPQLVQRSLQPAAVFKAGVAALILGAGAGFAAAAMSDWRLLGFAVAGCATAAFYTTGPRLKYQGLGLLMAALGMGVLMVLASYFAQARTITLGSLAVSLPVTCLVGAILHGNDLRDRATDCAARIKTVALIVGERNARVLFYVLHLAPYLIIAVSVGCRILPAWSLLCLLALPLSLAAVATCAVGFRAHDAARIAKLEGMSAGTHFIFGVLLVVGLLSKTTAAVRARDTQAVRPLVRGLCRLQADQVPVRIIGDLSPETRNLSACVHAQAGLKPDDYDFPLTLCVLCVLKR